MTVFVAPIGTGLGDVLISQPVLQALLDKNEKVVLVTRSFRQLGLSARLNGLSGEIAESDLHLAPGDSYINLRAHPLQTDWIWGSPEFEAIYGQTSVEKIITLIAADHGLNISYQKLVPLIASPLPWLTGHIIFVPGTDGSFKHWPTSYWLDLAARLKKAGRAVTMLGRPQESAAVRELLDAGLHWYETIDSGAAVDAISSASLVVAVDTGLMHIALQQNIPTIALLHPRMYHQRSAPSCFNFVGLHCPAQCGQEELNKDGFMAAEFLDVEIKYCRHVCPLGLALEGSVPPNCMSVITPDMVMAKILEEK